MSHKTTQAATQGVSKGPKAMRMNIKLMGVVAVPQPLDRFPGSTDGQKHRCLDPPDNMPLIADLRKSANMCNNLALD